MASLIKISAPRFSVVVPRERVFHILDDCMRRPSVWVASPAGSGKTTLVANYLEARNLPCLWYRADSGDGDIATFFYYMGLAAGKAAPRFRKSLPLLAPEYLPGIAVFAKRYFEELYRRLKPPFVIVLDNYHEIPIDSPLHKIVNIGLSCLPEGIRVVVISRNIPPQSFARLRANSEMGLLGWNDIRLTEDETRRIARSNTGQRFDEATLSILHKRTEGWVAGLVLFMESSKDRPVDLPLSKAFWPDEIFRYFASEIFDKADRETREFLLRTSFLDAMSVPMAEALTSIKKAGRLLQTLHEHNYFTERRLGEEAVYSYHALFRDFLRARAREEFSGHGLSAIQGKAAAVLLASGQVEEAAALLIEARDWNVFVPFVLKDAPSLMAQGRSRTLEGWLAAIPEEIAVGQPWILYWRGVCMLGISPADSRNFLERAFHLFEGMGDEAGTLSAWSAAVDTFFFELADFRPLDKWIRWLDARMQKGVIFPSVEVEARVAAGMTGALAWRMPDHPDMKKWLNTSLALAPKGLNVEGRIRAYLDIVMYYLWMGDFAECTLMVDQIKKMGLSKPISPMMEITAKFAEAILSSAHTDSSEHALRIVASGLETAEKTGVHVMDLHLVSMGSLSSLGAGRMTLAFKYLSELEKIFENDRAVGAILFLYQSAWAYLLIKNTHRAVALAKKAVQLAEKTGIPIPEAFTRLVLALSLCETKDFGGAGRQLEILRDIATRTGSSHLDYLHQIALAHCAFTRNDDDPAHKALSGAMSLGRQKDYATLVNFLGPDHMSRLCVKALEAGYEVEYVRDIVRRQRLCPEEPFVEIENWPWPVRIYTLGKFELYLDGSPARFQGKAQKKPLQMLKAIIALGGRSVKKHRLMDLLWPEAEGDKAMSAFTSTLSRLRTLIGSDKSIVVHEGGVSLNPRYCWVDAWTFEKLADQVEAGYKRPPDPAGKRNGKEDAALAEKAIGLFGGAFLSGEDGQPWVFPFREHLMIRFCRLVSGYGKLLEAAEKWEEAAECYRRALDLDDIVDEVLYQRLMTSYCRNDQPARATEVYRRLTRTLSVTLGIKPSQKTETIYKSLARTSGPADTPVAAGD